MTPGALRKLYQAYISSIIRAKVKGRRWALPAASSCNDGNFSLKLTTRHVVEYFFLVYLSVHTCSAQKYTSRVKHEPQLEVVMMFLWQRLWEKKRGPTCVWYGRGAVLRGAGTAPQS